MEMAYKDRMINCANAVEKTSKASRHVVFVKRKEQIINNLQKSCFSAVTRMICRLISIVKIV